MGLLDIITGEMLLVPGVEAYDSGRDDVELRVGGKAFAHIHRPDRIDVRLPLDVKENVLSRGIASRPACCKREAETEVRFLCLEA